WSAVFFSTLVISVLTLLLSGQQPRGSGKRRESSVEIDKGIFFTHLSGHLDDLAEKHVMGTGRHRLDHPAFETDQRIAEYRHLADTRHPGAFIKPLFPGHPVDHAGETPG